MKFFLPLVWVFFAHIQVAAAGDRLQVQAGLGSDHLPYKATIFDQHMVTAGRLAVPVPAQCLQYVVNGDTVGIGATCLNPAIMDGT